MPTTNFRVFSGIFWQRRANQGPGPHDDEKGERRAERGYRHPRHALVASGLDSEGDDDEGDLQPLKENALEGGRHSEGVEPFAGGHAARAKLGKPLLVDCLLVVQRLEAGVPHYRLFQPLEAEEDEEQADDETQRFEGNVADEGSSQNSHDCRKCNDGKGRPGERAAPVDSDADDEHDGEGLHELDRGGKKRSDEHCPEMCDHDSHQSRRFPNDPTPATEANTSRAFAGQQFSI